jgi:hypothetical protein
MPATRSLLLPYKPVGHVGLARPTLGRSNKLNNKAAATSDITAVADVQSVQHLRAALEDLESVHANLTDDEVEAKVASIEKLSSELGANKV